MSTTTTLEPTTDRAELWERYPQAGHGSPVENELVGQYLPLVKAVVGRLAMSLPAHVDIDDLFSAGLVGLLNALRRFNVHSGASFETYARLRIRGAVFDELRRMDWVPRSVHDKARKVQETMLALEQELGAVPGERHMARAMNLSVDDYRELLEQIRPATFICLDSVRGAEQEDGPSQYECIADPTQTDPSVATARLELARMIGERMQQLPEMQRKVLALYYFEDLRLREIAEVFGVTESRICQIHAQAVLSIKSHLLKLEATLA
jgi:RNA polymerase sigma factor for flagellar operon FliA